MNFTGTDKSGAILDQTGAYRYLLWRVWDRSAPQVAFAMLNPSTADASRNDPTIRRCIQFAQAWGYGGLRVVNLFAYRTAHPQELRRAIAPIGLENDAYILKTAAQVDRLILAWGNWGTLCDRHQQVLQLFSPEIHTYCLGLTQLGQPRHPLYIKRGVVAIKFRIS
jgi:hypothetical protein